MERIFDAAPDDVADMVSHVAGQAVGAKVPDRRIPQIELAAEEIVVNIIKHAYKEKGGRIAIRTMEGEEMFRAEFEDNGDAFDPLSMDEPDVKLDLEERMPGGLGIMLVRKMMDEVAYRRDNDRNIVRIGVNKRLEQHV